MDSDRLHDCQPGTSTVFVESWDISTAAEHVPLPQLNGFLILAKRERME